MLLLCCALLVPLPRLIFRLNLGLSGPHANQLPRSAVCPHFTVDFEVLEYRSCKASLRQRQYASRFHGSGSGPRPHVVSRSPSAGHDGSLLSPRSTSAANVPLPEQIVVTYCKFLQPMSRLEAGNPSQTATPNLRIGNKGSRTVTMSESNAVIAKDPSYAEWKGHLLTLWPCCQHAL